MTLSQPAMNGQVSSPSLPPRPIETSNKDASPQSDIFNASSVAEIKAALSRLHTQEASVTARLDALVTSQKDFSRELSRLDLMRANIGTQTTTTRTISHGMLSEAAGTADRISRAVRRLDLEQARVKATLEVVEQVAELKACALGVAGSMGASQDWETAASYLHRAAQVPSAVTNGAFAAEMVPTAEVPDPPSVTLDTAAESLCGLFLREFEKAVKENDGAKITRFFKLFPLIGRSEVGLDVYGRYVCQGVAARARGNLNAGPGTQTKDGFFYANALTKLFEHIAQIIDGHGGLVERHYGPRKMSRVIERLQVEADVQGGIILDTWGDERHVDRKLMEIKSYAFTFLVQSFLPAQRPGQARTQSPAIAAATTEDEGVDMKEIDEILNEMGIMLGRWSLYCRFLADTCNPPSEDEDEAARQKLELPTFLEESSLARKVNDRLVTPFNAMTTFFFRRSVEKAFQLDESPSGLSLNMQRPLKADPPHITSAVDDIMYIVNKVLQQSLATSHEAVVTNVVPTLSRVLGSDFIGMTQRKMRDECYPRPVVQGGQPPENLIIAFLVQINNLDIGIDYIRRIVQNTTGSKQPVPASKEGSQENAPEVTDYLLSLFPARSSALVVAQTLHSLASSFESKVNDLLTDGIQVVFNNVIKNRLRPILADAFRDIEYQPSSDADVPLDTQDDYNEHDGTSKEIVRPRFAAGWSDLLVPIARILTQQAFDRLLTVTISYFTRLLEKRLWSYQGRVNPLGAARLERDIAGLVSAAVDVGYGSGTPSRYRHREALSRCVQMTLVMSMDEDEWDEVLQGGEAAEVVDKLTREERVRVRAMVRRG